MLHERQLHVIDNCIKYTVILIFTICVSINIVNSCGNKNETINSPSSIDSIALDSINNIIYNLETIILKQDKTIDSLVNIKSKLYIKYETDIKNFNDVHVVSDDSIASYIRSKINNI